MIDQEFDAEVRRLVAEQVGSAPQSPTFDEVLKRSGTTSISAVDTAPQRARSMNWMWLSAASVLAVVGGLVFVTRSSDTETVSTADVRVATSEVQAGVSETVPVTAPAAPPAPEGGRPETTMPETTMPETTMPEPAVVETAVPDDGDPEPAVSEGSLLSAVVDLGAAWVVPNAVPVGMRFQSASERRYGALPDRNIEYGAYDAPASLRIGVYPIESEDEGTGFDARLWLTGDDQLEAASRSWFVKATNSPEAPTTQTWATQVGDAVVVVSSTLDADGIIDVIGGLELAVQPPAVPASFDLDRGWRTVASSGGVPFEIAAIQQAADSYCLYLGDGEGQFQCGFDFDPTLSHSSRVSVGRGNGTGQPAAEFAAGMVSVDVVRVELELSNGTVLESVTDDLSGEFEVRFWTLAQPIDFDAEAIEGAVLRGYDGDGQLLFEHTDLDRTAPRV